MSEAGRGIRHLITGEYPPQPGGVSDYSAQVASALASAGVEVHVWSPAATGASVDPPGVTVHRSAGSWARADFDRLDARLDEFPSPRILLVQYVPNAWNRRGMNVGFCRWLHRRRERGDSIRLMFHEVRYTLLPGDRPTRRLLVAVQTGMARSLIRASDAIYVSVPAWADLLRRIAPRSTTPIAWAPIPSGIVPVDDPSGVAEVRRRYAPGGEMIVGRFGTFRESTTPILVDLYPAVLKDRPECVGLLIGRGADRFVRGVLEAHPELAGRLFAADGLSMGDVSRSLQACDVLVQPDTGGVSTKQSSTMAGLAHGRAVVVGKGRLTESVWAEERCVALAESPGADALAAAVGALLDDPAERLRLGEASRSTYVRLFSAERTAELLMGGQGSS